MELVLKRIAKKDDYTIGRLYVRKTVLDEYSAGEELEYVCDTLEPKWRDYANGANKIRGKSAIPEGRYPVVITYSPTIKQWLPLLVMSLVSLVFASMPETRQRTRRAASSWA